MAGEPWLDYQPVTPAPTAPTDGPWNDYTPQPSQQALESEAQAPPPWADYATTTPASTPPVQQPEVVPLRKNERGAVGTFLAEAAHSAIGLPGEALKGAAIGLGQFSDEPIRQSALYSIGEKMKKYAETWGAGDDAVRAHPWAATAGSVVGGAAPMAPVLAASAIGAPAAATLGLAGAALGGMGAAAGAGAFDEALLKGADENTASKVAGLNAIVAGGLGAIPLGALLAPVRAYAPGLTGWAAQTIEKALVGGITFAGVGEAQDFLGRQIAKNFYDPTAAYDPSLDRVIGSLIGGGIVGTITPKMMRAQERGDSKPLTEKEVGDLYAQLSRVPEVKPVTLEELAGGDEVKLPQNPTQSSIDAIHEQRAQATGTPDTKEKGFTVYHGSGQVFDEWNPTFIGTGEGNASFGYAPGGYHGEAKATGKQYARERAIYFYGDEPYNPENPLHRAALYIQEKRSREAALAYAESSAARATEGPAHWKNSALDDAAAKLLKSDVQIGELSRRGNVYTNRILRSKDEFLDLDKTLEEQPLSLQKAVEKALEPLVDKYQNAGAEIPNFKKMTGRQIYEALSVTSPEEATNLLKNAGVAGNKYPDAGSRQTSWKVTSQFPDGDPISFHMTEKPTDQGIRDYLKTLGTSEDWMKKVDAAKITVDEVPPTYNYAVFDPKDVQVTHRNGKKITPLQAKAIKDVQAGHPVFDEHGRAIVNGREVPDMSPEELARLGAERPERIQSAAVRIDGQVYTGAFHPDAFEAAARALGTTTDELAARVGKEKTEFQGEPAFVGGGNDVDGFVTNRGRYVDRMEAARIAEAQDQVESLHKKGEPLSADALKPWTAEDQAQAQSARTNGIRQNDNAMRAQGVKDFPNTPQTDASQPERRMFKNLNGGQTPPEARAIATAKDHFWRHFRWMWDIVALADANPHIRPLQIYRNTLHALKNFATQIHVKAEDTLKAAWKLSQEDKVALTKFIDDWVNMTYLTPDERAKQVVRHALPDELKKLVADSGLSKKGIAVFTEMQKDIKNFRDEVIKNMRNEALDTLGGKDLAKRMTQIDNIEANLANRPFFPTRAFGYYYLVKKGPNGTQVWRRETERERDKVYKQQNRTLQAGETLERGLLPQSSTPFMGLPAQLLDAVQKQMLPKTKNSVELNDAINLLKYESDPLQGVMRTFGKKTLPLGYSDDFMRSFANFFFHGGRYLARQRYLPELEAHSNQLFETAGTLPEYQRTLRTEIAQFVRDHLAELKDPRPDWALPRAFLFHWMLGFRPASAATNLTQSLISTYPHLAREFGDVRATSAMMQAASDWRKIFQPREAVEKLAMTGPEMRALNEMMQRDKIRGAQTPELAGTSEARNLQNGYGRGKWAAFVNSYAKASGFLFDLSEQGNRRVAGMATFKLAMKDNAAKFVERAVENDPATYAELINKGIPTNEARSIVAAMQMIDRTQFAYSQEFRPAYMKGTVPSTIFTFKLFTHRMLWNMYNYPSALARQLLIFGFLGGAMGIPGMQDLNGILKAVASNVFGKDYDLEDEAKRFAVDMLGMKGGKGYMDDPYTITKGFASRGYGIGALADFLGEWAGVGNVPVPVVDRSAAVAMSNILPIDVGVLFGPKAHKDPAGAFAESISRGMGAAGTLFYNSYKALQNINEGPEEMKRWERVMPSYIGGISHALRLYLEGSEKSRSRADVVRFDPHDTEHMMEILSIAAGYTPLRLSKEWSRIRAEAEGQMFWEVRREALLNQYWAAASQRDKADTSRVRQAIINFNNELKGTPARGYAITGDTLERSMQARAMTRAKQEAGAPRSEAAAPLIQDIRRLFPGSQVEIRKER